MAWHLALHADSEAVAELLALSLFDSAANAGRMVIDLLGWRPLRESTGTVSMCWLFEGPRITVGIHFPLTSLELAVSKGWEFEESLSAKFKFVPNSELVDAMDS
jgi:hypothetical protein